MPVDKFGRMSDVKTTDAGVSLTYINNNYIRSYGTTPVSGSIDMRGNTLYNVSDPVNPQDVATKEYADKVGETLKENLNKRPHIIVVNTYYCGNLYKDEYQFTFGGSACTALELGFLVPQSGRIKKIKSKVIGNEDIVRTILIGRHLAFVILRVTGEVSILQNFRCDFAPTPPSGDIELVRESCEYTPTRNTLISEGDIINIKTLRDYITEKNQLSFLFTILIELDPL